MPWHSSSIASRILAGALGLAILNGPSTPRSFAHEGPEHEIEEITSDIERLGESPDRLIERAIEYGVLGKAPEAIRDLDRALQLDPSSLHALRELGRMQYQAGRTNDALATVGRALRQEIEEPANQGGLLVLRAEILRARGQFRSALADCTKAIQLHPYNPEWYLLQSDLQRRLGQHRKRLESLDQGLRSTGAGVLQTEKVEAQLDARKYRDALKLIETELAESRIRHAWLLRRARARIGLGNLEGAMADAQEALEEVDRLSHPNRPDTDLLLSRAMAVALLGDPDSARRILESAGASGVPADVLERFHSALRHAKAIPSN